MEKDIGKITKNDSTDIVVRIDDFGGKIGLTIREFVTGERYTGFTKAGVRIPASEFKKFKDIINSIDEADLEAESSESSGTAGSSEEEQDKVESIKVGEQPSAPSESETDESLPDY